MPRLLDLYCKAGGASMGYHRAGFEVVGVDIEPQPHYPFEFVQSDALQVPLHGFDAIHASPPCQRFSQANRGLGNHMKYPDLVAKTRSRLEASGVPWVIENVVGAPLFFPILLCGTMFSLECDAGWLRRHRYFETSHVILGVPHCQHRKDKPSIGVYGNGTNSYNRQVLGRNITTEEQREVMGIPWMVRSELTQAVPPAYTEWIGSQLVSKLTEGK